MSEIKKAKLQSTKWKEVKLLKNNRDECLPIKTMVDLKNWKPSIRNHATIPLQHREDFDYRENTLFPKTLLCHDMKGGYLDDRFIDGTESTDNYYFLHWTAIDIFVYFSHHFITIPPCGWISAAHKNGVKILGTIITEWDEGRKICEELFNDERTVEDVTLKLVDIADYHNFDGWLINIENKIQEKHIPLLKKFVKTFTEKMHFRKPESQVIWYDSVLETGELKWQNALNEKNKTFFDCCDGIFLNYNWTTETLQLSTKIAGERNLDIFVGVDVFGRGCPGGGGFCTDFAITEARKFNLSVAIFAPGWIYECFDVKDLKENQKKFWDALQKLCPPKVTIKLPYYSSFCPGFGKKMFGNGKVLSDKPWFNLSLQQPQPIYYSEYCSSENLGEAIITNYDKDAYNGGGCIYLKANVKKDDLVTYKILKTSFILQKGFIISYVFKPLTPHIDVSLKLLTTNSCWFLGVTNNKLDSLSNFLPPDSTQETEENWIKRSFLLDSNSNFHDLQEIHLIFKAGQDGENSVLLGELQVLPVVTHIGLRYRNLKCQNIDENLTSVDCDLEWDFHPSICNSDLFFFKNDGEKQYICRTSQFYYHLEFITDQDYEQVLLNVQHHGKEQLLNGSIVVIPVKSI